jgi:hypothetical protein
MLCPVDLVQLSFHAILRTNAIIIVPKKVHVAPLSARLCWLSCVYMYRYNLLVLFVPVPNTGFFLW